MTVRAADAAHAALTGLAAARQTAPGRDFAPAALTVCVAD
jgi:hypothetical protein